MNATVVKGRGRLGEAHRAHVDWKGTGSPFLKDVL